MLKLSNLASIFLIVVILFSICVVSNDYSYVSSKKLILIGWQNILAIMVFMGCAMWTICCLISSMSMLISSPEKEDDRH